MSTMARLDDQKYEEWVVRLMKGDADVHIRAIRVGSRKGQQTGVSLDSVKAPDLQSFDS